MGKPIDKTTHCVACNAPLTDEDIEEGFETCVECDCDHTNDDVHEDEED